MEDLDQQKNREGDEDLATGAGHKGEEVIEGIATTENHLAVLGRDLPVGRILQQPPDAGRGNQQTDYQVHDPVTVGLAHQVDQQADTDAGRRRQAAQPAENQRRGGGVEILQGQGLVRGLVVVETEAHHQGGGQQAPVAGKEAGEADTETEQDDGEGREPMFAEHQHEEDRQQRQEARDLPNRADDPDLEAVEVDDFHREVIEKDLPALQANHRSDGLNEEEAQHRPLLA